MKRVEGTSGIKLIECVSPARNRSAGMYRNVRTDPPPTWRKALSADLTWIL